MTSEVLPKGTSIPRHIINKITCQATRFLSAILPTVSGTLRFGIVFPARINTQNV
jgi:hypothetical protein